MERKRRAEGLVSLLRWVVIVVGLPAAADGIPAAQIGIIVAAMAACNGILAWSVSSTALFVRLGRKVAFTVRLLDIAAVTFVVANSHSAASPVFLLYWFVLVGTGFACADTRKLLPTTLVVAAANAGAGFYALSYTGELSGTLSAIGVRTGAIVLGYLVSAYIAKSRSQDDLAAERGSYLHAILNCGTRLTSFRTVHELASYVLQAVVNETGSAGGRLMLVNEESHELQCEASYVDGRLLEPEQSRGAASNPDPTETSVQGYANWVVTSGREILTRVRGSGGDDETISDDNRPVIATPLLWQSSSGEAGSTVLGVLIVWGISGEDFAEDAADIVRILAAMSAGAIVNLRLYTNLQKSFLRTLQSLANGLEARDEYTRGHSERVMQIACLVGQELGVSGEGIDLLRNASLLHDIGKIGVPDAILRKSGKLTSEEWESMRRHPIVSEEICRPLGLPPEILFLVKHHHERLDGKGYPAALSGPEQPLLQRILVVADSFDAMRSRRPYRDIMPQEELRIELNKAAGRSMDPTVVDTLLRLLDEGDLDAVYEEHDRMTAVQSMGDSPYLRKAA